MVDTEERVITSAQPFGSPGGKTYLAPRIVEYLPPHKIYVEPFVGGGAVFYRKYPSEVEVLNDKDQDIIFMNRFIRDMTKENFEKLKRKNWVGSREQFDKVKAMSPQKDEVDEFYRVFYLRKMSFASGDKTYSKYTTGRRTDIDKLWKTHERLSNVKINSGDYLKMIEKYDSPDTLFYLDPPYPSRSFVGQEFDNFTEEKLQELINKLQHIKGKFILSLGVESTKYIPKSWHVKRVQVHRHMAYGNKDFNKGFQYEILVSKQEIRPHIVTGNNGHKSHASRKPKQHRNKVTTFTRM